MHIISPNWPAPHFVKAYTVAHPTHAKKFFKDYLQQLQQHFTLNNPPIFLEQIHSDIAIQVDESIQRQGDATITQQCQQALLILTADCLPIMICHRHQKEIANIHAGWKGLYAGVIENTFTKLQDSPKHYLAWIGPAICSSCYAVGEEFRDHFLKKYPSFQPYFKKNQSWYFDLAAAANHLLKKLGVEAIYQSRICTFEQKRLFSYRREKESASRLGSIIWLED